MHPLTLYDMAVREHERATALRALARHEVIRPRSQALPEPARSHRPSGHSLSPRRLRLRTTRTA
ncbi:MAG TPA: hypothetical protein VGK35_07945 [Actinotalea sp.]|jgi:hypothetical protein